MNSQLPIARRDQVTVQELDGEIILYDGKTARANVLNHTAAVIWKLCDGQTSVGEIAQRASKQLNAPVDEALVWYTLDQLSKKNLLETRAAMPLNFKGMTRRDFIRAGAIGAAVVLPVVVAMSAPKVTHAASCAGLSQSCLDLPCCEPFVCGESAPVCGAF